MALIGGRPLLRRQLELYRRIGVKDGAVKLEAVLAGQAGRIERMNCLETLLFAAHEARFPVEDTQSEFMAVVMRRGPDLKVYLLSHGSDPGAFQRLAREYGMREAWITNGFESLRLAVPDVDLLVARVTAL